MTRGEARGREKTEEKERERGKGGRRNRIYTEDRRRFYGRTRSRAQRRGRLYDALRRSVWPGTDPDRHEASADLRLIRYADGPARDMPTRTDHEPMPRSSTNLILSMSS